MNIGLFNADAGRQHPTHSYQVFNFRTATRQYLNYKF